jgi:UDP-N-acetylglucosamine pyrophosphorylase
MASGKQHDDLIQASAKKMREAGLSEIAIRAFESNVRRYWEDSHIIRESAIEPLSPDDVVHFDKLEKNTGVGGTLLSKTAILKLNGGLGTTMGLDGPKALLPVKNSLNFLDIIVRQTIQLRETYRARVRLIFMNSYNTSIETMAYLQKHYPALAAEPDIELLQNRVPKIHESEGKPIEHSADPDLEWCPPGHGDIYVCMQHSNLLDRLLGAGVLYLFVSNSDNLGATLDLNLLSHFAASGASFMMEVAERTVTDQKGGHLARTKSGNLVLRESAQCHEEDRLHFQNIGRHRYFNTNNLWIRLDRLRDLLHQFEGLIPLPVIRNLKKVDPKNAASTQVIQYETAMGAAIEVFEDAQAIVVPRARFAPVKTNADLDLLRSDAYALTEDYRLVPKRR